MIECGCRIKRLPHVEGVDRNTEMFIEYCDAHSGGIGSSEAFALLRSIPRDAEQWMEWEKRRVALLGGG